MLQQRQHSCLSSVFSRWLQVFYELWHSRLGHASFDIISFLNKVGCLSVTFIIPTLQNCASCQLSKSKHLPFDLNSKHSLYVLDMIYYDLYGPSPIDFTDRYCYYVVFVDDFSWFSWFYPLKAKSNFYVVLQAFVNLVKLNFHVKSRFFNLMEEPSL